MTNFYWVVLQKDHLAFVHKPERDLWDTTKIL